MQSLRQLQLGWDIALPVDVQSKWQTLYDTLPQLETITIPRWLGLNSDNIVGELHGFSDASERAYAAVVYVRVPLDGQRVAIRLVTCKTKVAPLKQLSIPRLELCGAVLLARLLHQLTGLPEFAKLSIFCWSDSTIVLSWLNQPSVQWKTFVANRVSEVQTLLPDVSWNHVAGSDNPADLASRGTSPHELAQSSVWWNGPTWLSLDASYWPSRNRADIPRTNLECKSHDCIVAIPTAPHDDFESIVNRFSSWTRFLHVVARMLRYSPHWRVSIGPIQSRILHAEELHHVKIRCLRLIQEIQFSSQLSALSKRLDSKPYVKSVDKSLRKLCPFMDSDGLLRINGRLEHSSLPYSVRHPILMKPSHFSRLLIRDAHLRCLHGGISLTLSTLRDSFWIIRERKMIKSEIFQCIRCARDRAETPTQMMGTLPSARVTIPERPFIRCGVDYTGPIRVRMAGGRGIKSQAAYIAIFVCMAVKAVHLEVATDYSAEAFLAAFHRFSARRGLPNIMYSDNGTNFVGTAKELARVFQSVTSDPAVQARLATDGVKWSFIPPGASHFGGIWEAGVKTVKTHMRRVLGAHMPTFEELCTLLCRIEACMNSRPLSPITDDLDSLDALTPAHFLLGGPISAVVQESVLDLSCNRLSRWQLMQQMLEQFWRRWSDDYVRSCQQRTKWHTITPSQKIGQLVLMRNSALPPTKWELGRIIRCHPGSDGLVRVITVKTAKSEYVRPITKIAVLPVIIVITSQ